MTLLVTQDPPDYQLPEPPPPGPWHAEGACRAAREVDFFDEESPGPAKAVCAGCPVLEACRAYAREQRPEGVWGGETAENRRRGRNNAKKQAWRASRRERGLKVI